MSLLSLDWLSVLSMTVVIGLSDYFNLVLVLRHSTENRSISIVICFSCFFFIFWINFMWFLKGHYLPSLASYTAVAGNFKLFVNLIVSASSFLPILNYVARQQFFCAAGGVLDIVRAVQYTKLR